MDSKSAEPGQYLTFHLRSQIYGVPIGTVREINRFSDITAVPQTPEYMAGVMNLRGKVIPVVDLRKKLGLDSIAPTKATCIIVFEIENGPVGAIVDSVSGVITLDEKQLAPAPTQQGIGAFVVGMGKLESSVVILLDSVRCVSPSPSEKVA